MSLPNEGSISCRGCEVYNISLDHCYCENCFKQTLLDILDELTMKKKKSYTFFTLWGLNSNVPYVEEYNKAVNEQSKKIEAIKEKYING